MVLVLCVLQDLFLAAAHTAEPVGAFFESDFPFFQTPVELPAGPGHEMRQVVVRGIVLRVPGNLWVLFDQELLRVAAFWQGTEGKPPVELASMAQVSYSEPHRKAGNTLPKPTSALLMVTRPTPGVSLDPKQLLKDPRPTSGATESGRGPLPVGLGRFEGVELQGNTACVLYRVGEVVVREWLESVSGTLVRRLEMGPHTAPLHLALAEAQNWKLSETDTCAASDRLGVTCKGAKATLRVEAGGLRAMVPASRTTETLKLSYTGLAGISGGSVPGPDSPNKDGQPARRRWSKSVSSTAKLAAEQLNGLVCDSIGLPVSNPWKRRIRPADIAFVSGDQAAVVTYDGDVWMVDGFERFETLTWRRFASGLNEPLTIAAPAGILQVYTRNGLVRLHDRDHNGEADWYENFSDVWVQSSSTRAFPLDMAVSGDGSTYISQGGIGMGTPFAGAISRISADGRHAERISTRAREPYLALHPETGLLTSTDQQGSFIPSSVCYLVKPGANFGFGQEQPSNLTPPLVWIPHHEDNSCASQIWLSGRSFGPLTGKLLHLSYGKGTPLLICPDLEAPVPQGAVIPLGLPTRVPLLHARLHPKQAAVFGCGFQIYDSRAETNWGLVRIRLDGKAVTTPVDARSTQDGVLIRFSEELASDSVTQEGIFAASWNYRRSKEYGSGRYTKAGAAGIDPEPIGQVVLSQDRKTVFVHLPNLGSTMQLGISYQFRFRKGGEAKGNVYFTVHQPNPLDLQAMGFPGVDLARSVPVIRLPKGEPPTRQRGKELSVQMGCVACHSIDGSTEGKTGPTWKGLFGKDRYFADGSMESANEYYIRASILEPEKKIVAGYHAGMASYKGVLTEDQIDSIILYIRSLQ